MHDKLEPGTEESSELPFIREMFYLVDYHLFDIIGIGVMIYCLTVGFWYLIGVLLVSAQIKFRPSPTIRGADGSDLLTGIFLFCMIFSHFWTTLICLFVIGMCIACDIEHKKAVREAGL